MAALHVNQDRDLAVACHARSNRAAVGCGGSAGLQGLQRSLNDAPDESRFVMIPPLGAAWTRAPRTSVSYVGVEVSVKHTKAMVGQFEIWVLHASISALSARARR